MSGNYRLYLLNTHWILTTMLLSRDTKIHVVILVDMPLYDGESLTESGEEQNKNVQPNLREVKPGA